MSQGQLEQRVSKALWRSIDFFLHQYDSSLRGWGKEPGTAPDAWTTAEVLSLLGSVGPISSDVIEGGVTYLLDSQNLDGSWGSTFFGGDVPASAYSVIALAGTFSGEHRAIGRALDWLVDTFRQGWTTSPDDPQARFGDTHFYSSAMALRALIRAPRSEHLSVYIQETISRLLAGRAVQGGWGYGIGRPADPTFTCYVLHALMDAPIRLGVESDSRAIDAALEWLQGVQTKDGCWGDWHGMVCSPEATGYAIYSLLRGAKLPDDATIVSALHWLIQQQQDDGGWLFDPLQKSISNNWVTFSVSLGLRAYLARIMSAGLHPEQKAEGTIVDVDAVSLVRPAPPVEAQQSRDQRTQRYENYFPFLPEELRGPVARPLDHTMSDAVDEYVKQRVPEKEIREVINRAGKVELHQIYPDDFLGVSSLRRWTIDSEIRKNNKPKSKRVNHVRPRFFRGHNENGAERLWIAVTPGLDYLLHYGLLARHVISMRTVEWRRCMALYRYPVAERNLVQWTRLSEVGLAQEDLVVIGFVSEVGENLLRLGASKVGTPIENAYYLLERLVSGARRISLLGVKFSFWGSIAGQITELICKSGAREILYIGKLGALTTPDDIYRKIFCPTQFLRLRHMQDFKEEAPPNYILDAFPALDTGIHVSVPTVLEEDYVQRGKATALQAKSIDNEISVIASEIGAWNRAHAAKIGFTCLHFATDYIRQPTERAIVTKYDLGRDKTPGARKLKAKMVTRIVRDILHPYCCRATFRPH